MTAATQKARASEGEGETSFGVALHRARRDAGLKLVDLAHRAGISEGYLRGIERGDRTPDGRVFWRLCWALGEHAEDLPIEWIDAARAVTLRTDGYATTEEVLLCLSERLAAGPIPRDLAESIVRLLHDADPPKLPQLPERENVRPVGRTPIPEGERKPRPYRSPAERNYKPKRRRFRF